MSKIFMFQCDFPGCAHTFKCSGKKLHRSTEEMIDAGWEKAGQNTHYCPDHTHVKIEKQALNTLVWTVDQYEAARMLKVSPAYLQHQRFLGQPPTFVRIGNRIRYRVKDLEEFLNNQTVHPAHL